MAIKNKSDLTTQTNTLLADNPNGDISEGDSRTVHNEIIESAATYKDAGTFEKNQKINAKIETYAASITVDLDESDYFEVTLTGDPTINVPSNVAKGMPFTLVFIQDATGSRQPVWNGAFEFSSGDGSLDGTASKSQSVYCLYHSSSYIEATMGKEQG